jgi:hypothetical protein
MGDAAEFLGSYQEALDAEVARGDWPSQVTDTFTFESCLKHREGKDIYLVVDKRTEEKAILRVSTAVSNFMEQPDNEYGILKDLDHPGIPKILDVFTEGDKTYTIREYFPGKPLDEVIASRPMATSELFDITQKVCDILGYLHAHIPPIIHRDIKPHNLILMPDGRIGLTDFDIARTYKPEQDFDTRYAGTVPYAPPEQFGYTQSTPQADIHALGIALIHLATGSPNPDDLAARVTDKHLRTLIERCIAFDPTQRFGDAGQILHYLERMKSRKLRRAAVAAGSIFAGALLVFGGFSLIKAMQSEVPTEAPPIQESNEADYPPGADPLTYENPLIDNPTLSDRPFDAANDGNLASNIHAGGYAVEVNLGDFFYVIDGESLYLVNGDGQAAQKLFENKYLCSLNGYDGSLYFSTSKGIVRFSETGWRYDYLTDEVGSDILFDNGRLYFANVSDGGTFGTVRIDGTDVTLFSDVSLDPFSSYPNMVDGVLYYANTHDSNRIYYYDRNSGVHDQLYEGNCRSLSVCNGNLYFIDDGRDGAIMRMNLTSHSVTKIADGYHCSINATALGLFAIEGTPGTQAGALVVMDGNGENKQVLQESSVLSFNIVQNWIFYAVPLGSHGSDLWLMRLDGSESHPFDPGELANNPPAGRLVEPGQSIW